MGNRHCSRPVRSSLGVDSDSIAAVTTAATASPYSASTAAAIADVSSIAGGSAMTSAAVAVTAVTCADFGAVNRFIELLESTSTPTSTSTTTTTTTATTTTALTTAVAVTVPPMADIKSDPKSSPAPIGGPDSKSAAGSSTAAALVKLGDGTLRVLVRVDHPAKDQLVALDAKSTLGDLRGVIAKIDGLDAKAVPRYGLLNVAYRGAVVDLTANEKTTDATVLSSLGVKDSTTIIARAPADIAPRKRRLNKKKKEDEDEKKKDEGKAVSANRYKGITINNIWKKLEDSKAPAGKQKLYYEFFDIYASKLVKKTQFTLLPKETVIAICKSDTLNVKEIELFDAVIAWGTAKLKKDGGKEDEKGAELKNVLADVITHIRFGCMTTQDVAIKVSASGFLDADQILELFTYLGMKSGNKNAVPGKALAKFVSRERKGRRPPSWFKFDSNKKHYNLQLNAEGNVVTSNNTGNYQPIFGDVELTEGVWEWEIVMTQFTTQAHACNIGVVPTTFTNYTVGHMIGYSGHVPGWAFAVGNAQKQHGADMQAYGRTAVQGDAIGVRLDLDKKTIEFFINGASQGVAFRDVFPAVRPAISIYGTNSVTLRFPAGELKSAEK